MASNIQFKCFIHPAQIRGSDNPEGEREKERERSREREGEREKERERRREKRGQEEVGVVTNHWSVRESTGIRWRMSASCDRPGHLLGAKGY